MTTNRRLGSLQVLTHLLDALRGALTKEIALAVSDLGDAVDRPQARKVAFLEHYSTPSQPLHDRLDVFDLPRHLSVISCGGPGRLEEPELPLTTAVEQTSGQLYARFETQLLCVERSGPLEILCRDPRRDLAVFKHSHRPPSYRVALDGIAGQVGRHPPFGGYCGPGGDPRGRLSRRPWSGYRRTRPPRTPSLSFREELLAATRRA